MIGYVRFHSRPEPADDGTGSVEIGYLVFGSHRRRGYALEAIEAMMAWAARDVGRFVVSISPDNIPSLRLAERLGFTKVAEALDEVDGVEHVLVRNVVTNKALG